MKAKLRIFALSCFLLTLPGLTGCDQLGSTLGVETPTQRAARQEAEGMAVGGGCRQSGRAIEDCYAIYTWVPKEAVFAGWREMDTYMRENSLDTIPPVLPPVPPPDRRKKRAADDDDESAAQGPIPVPAPVPVFLPPPAPVVAPEAAPNESSPAAAAAPNP